MEVLLQYGWAPFLIALLPVAGGYALWRGPGRGLFTKGLGARVLWLAPGSAITIAVYDRLKATLNSSIGDR